MTKIKIAVSLVFLFCLSIILPGQNRVPNGGFETLIACPDKFTTQQIGLVPPWNTPSKGTPNIYHTCSSAPSLGVPSNSAGYENAHSGNGYAGIETSISNRTETEYIQVEMLNTLQKDKDYYFEMYASKADNSQLTSRLGVHFSYDSIYVNHSGFLTEIPQIFPFDEVWQSLGWQKISGIYHAAGGEKYITIGNFETNNPSSGAPFAYSYYYIDDISIRDTCLPQKDSGLLPADTSLCLNNLPLAVQPNKQGALDWFWNTANRDSMIEITYGDQYWVWVSNGICSYYDSMRVITLPVPTVNLGSDKTLCREDSLQLLANSAGNQIQWFNLETKETIYVHPPGKFWLRLSNDYGCHAIDTIKTDTFSAPIFSLGLDSFMCKGSSLNLQPDLLFSSYLWQNGHTQSNLPINFGGTYVLQVWDANHCSALDTIIISEKELPEPNIMELYPVCEPDFTLYPGSFISYLWQDGSKDSLFRITAYGQYHLIVKDRFQCVGEKSFSVENHCPGTFFVPNIFTPNQDGLNDYFIPVSKNMKDIEMFLFNRYGETIYYAKNPIQGWDGYFNGYPAPTGVYAYRINGISYEGSSISKSGNFTLIR